MPPPSPFRSRSSYPFKLRKQARRPDVRTPNLKTYAAPASLWRVSSTSMRESLGRFSCALAYPLRGPRRVLCNLYVHGINRRQAADFLLDHIQKPSGERAPTARVHHSRSSLCGPGSR